MKINKTQNGAELTVSLEGQLDTTTAPELESALEGLGGVTSLVIDITKLDYISSAGLRVLLVAQKNLEKNGGSLTVVGVNEDVKEIFEVTGFDEILNIKA
ncbi:MAG: STAS domain-containing protein [Fretibacterium sp.]|nr:STAS domain-containing protein [Fretibacterium sp.]